MRRRKRIFSRIPSKTGEGIGKFSIGQWNVNSFNQRKNEVRALISKHDFEILVLNDTRSCNRLNIEIQGYSIERHDHPDDSRRPGGSAIAIRNDLPFKRIPTTVKESVCIEASFPKFNVRIFTIYAHPGELVGRKLFEEVEADSTSSSTFFLLIGDFNAHVGLEGDRDPDRPGHHLTHLTNHFDYHLLNSNEATYSSCSNSTMTCIDLAYAKNNLGFDMNTSWEVLDPGSSDHFATKVELSLPNSLNTDRQLNNTIHKTDWERFSKGLTDSLKFPEKNPTCVSDVDSIITHLNKTIISELEKATVTIKILKKGDLILSKESRILIELRRSMLQFRRRRKGCADVVTRRILNKLSYDIKNQIKKDTDNNDKKRASAIMHETDPSKKWKLFKAFTSKGESKIKIGDIIDSEGCRQTVNDAKANAFANRLKNAHAYPSSPSFNTECEKDILEAFDNLSLHNHPTFDCISYSSSNDLHEEITIGEIMQNLSRTNSKAASGPDKISYRHIKEGGEKLLALLCYLFNILLLTGYFPDSWKNVDVKMLHKSGKAKLPVANYRPISLSNSLSKLFECCVKSRFEKKLSRLKPENLRQSAYKKNRGTQENCLKLTEDVTNAFNNKECVLGAFLDVSGAFDRVWKEGLIIKIARWGIGAHLTRIITNFLSSRSLVVKLGNSISNIVYLLAGTPQGSVLSPILFNAYMDDLWPLIPSGVELLQYADDICIYTSSSSPEINAKKIQETLNIIERWAGIWRIAMAPEKSSWLLFSRCPRHKKTTIHLNMYGKTIPQTDKVQFLGILFDERLTWKTYLDSIIRHATSKAVQIQALSAKNRFNDPIQAINFFNSVVKPLFDYGAVIYFAINSKQWDRLDRFHGRFLRSICGLPRCCSYVKLCKQLHQEKLSIAVKDQAAKRMIGICRTSPYSAAWILERGFTLIDDSLQQTSFHSRFDTYRSPVELALNRFLQLQYPERIPNQT